MRDSAPAITTIIPTYRRPQLLRRAIRSALAQTYPNLIVAVYDNASGDETAAVVAEFAGQDSRVRYHCHSENIGSNANFIYAMQHVETPYFSLLSDDDVLLPEFYASALESLEAHPDAIFAAGTVIEMDTKGRILGTNVDTWARDGYFTPPEGMYAMIGNNHPYILGILFRREVLTKFGLPNPQIVIFDVDLELRVAALFPYVIQKRPYAIFVQHAGSLSTTNPIPYLTVEWPKVLRNIDRDLRIPPDVRAHSVEALRRYLQEDTYRVGMRQALTRHTVLAYQAAAALRDQYGLKDRSRRLARIAALCRWVPPVAWAGALALRLRQARQSRRSKEQQRRFGAYARYLDLPK
jgi:glycosyltransferase involved in cell wall biosynthesis